MHDEIYTTWKEYLIYFKKSDKRTCEKILIRFGFVIPDSGAPIIRKSELDKKIDEQSARR
jgi:hypothetical protein